MVNTLFIGRTGDGLKPAEWLGPALAETIKLKPGQITEGILTLIRDDDRAGKCLIVDNPAGDGEPPQITRLKDPVEFYSFIAERAKAIAAMRS